MTSSIVWFDSVIETAASVGGKRKRRGCAEPQPPGEACGLLFNPKAKGLRDQSFLAQPSPRFRSGSDHVEQSLRTVI